jgi:hypothetical protein
MKSFSSSILFSLLLLFLSVFFYLWNLDNWFLWQDEASGALLAKNTLKFGFPFVFDGKNINWPAPTDVSPDGKYWILWGWLPVYINALIYKIFGISTFTSRLGSALVGILFIQISYWSLRRLFEKSVAEIVVLILLFCVPLSLFFRQCGYYAFVATIPFGMYLFLFHLSPTPFRHWGFILLSLALVNTHVLIWGVTLTAFGLLFLIRGGEKKLELKTLFFSGLFALPFLIFYEVWILSDRTQAHSGFSLYVIHAAYYLDSFCIAVFPVWYAMLLFILGCMIRKIFTESEKKTFRDVFIIIGFSLLMLPLITHAFFRYILFLIPFLALVVGIIHVRILKANRILGILMFLVLILHFGLGFRKSFNGFPSSFQIQQFFYELNHEGEDINEVLCNYLNTHAKHDEIVFCTYGEFPLQFYTSLKVRGGIGKIGIMPEKIFPEWGIHLMNTPPDWIVMREFWKGNYGNLFLQTLFKNTSYEKIVLPVEETPWGNRADPFHHFYATPTIQNPLVIYRRKK